MSGYEKRAGAVGKGGLMKLGWVVGLSGVDDGDDREGGLHVGRRERLGLRRLVALDGAVGR